MMMGWWSGALVVVVSAVGAATESPLYVYDLAPHMKTDTADAYEWPQLVAAMAGLVNRDGPILYTLWTDADVAWLSWLRQEPWLAGRQLVNITSPAELLSTFRHAFTGAVLYDPEVPQTSVVASTVCGVEGLLPVCHRPGNATSPYEVLVSTGLLKVGMSLVGRFDGHVTGSKKCDAVMWAVEEYLETGKVDGGFLAYYIDWFWVKAGALSFQINNDASNHDFFISKKGFFFDLSPWGDEIPNDDPHQPLGTDRKTMEAVLRAAYRQAGNGTRFLRVGGFPPFPWKYVSPHGKHQGVETEWEYALLISAYNGFMDADACCNYGAMANGAFFQHYPLRASYAQNPPPTREELQKQGMIDENVISPLCTHAWDDPARGKVPLGWGVDPELSLRFPPIWNHIFTTLSPMDRIISGDSGAGVPSGLPSAGKMWTDYNKPLYKRFDMSFTGFVINGDRGNLTDAAVALYLPFSPDGIVGQFRDPFMFGNMPVLRHSWDLAKFDPVQGIQEALNVINEADKTSHLGFHVFRTILQNASYHLEVADGITKSLGDKARVVEPLALSLLFRVDHGK